MDFYKAALDLGFKQGDVITPQVLKQQYRTLVKKHHPDVNSGEEKMFKVVNNAHEQLEKVFLTVPSRKVTPIHGRTANPSGGTKPGGAGGGFREKNPFADFFARFEQQKPHGQRVKEEERARESARFQKMYGSDYQEWFAQNQAGQTLREEVKKAYKYRRENSDADDDEDIRRKQNYQRFYENLENLFQAQEDLRRAKAKQEAIRTEDEKRQAAERNDPAESLKFVIFWITVAIFACIGRKNRDLFGFDSQATLAKKELTEMRQASAQAVIDSLGAVMIEAEEKEEQESDKVITTLIHIKDCIAALDSRGIYTFPRITEGSSSYEEQYGSFRGGGFSTIVGGKSGKSYDFSFALYTKSLRSDKKDRFNLLKKEDTPKLIKTYMYVVNKESTIILTVTPSGYSFTHLDGPRVSLKVLTDIEKGLLKMFP